MEGGDLIFNYDFGIAALFVEVIFIGFFLARRKLPVRQNRIFLLALFIQLLVTTVDIVSSIMDNAPDRYPLPLLLTLNTAYFVFYVARPAVFFLYTLEITRTQERQISRKVELLLMLPLFVAEALVLSTPVTGFAFEVLPDVGYRGGVGYNILYYMFFLYLVLTIVTVIAFRHNVFRGQFISILLYCGLLLLGNFVRLLFPRILIMDAFAEMAIIVIYLSLQNPDYYIEKMTSLFDTDAFLMVTGEWLVSGKVFSAFCFYIDQYDDMRTVYDVTIMNNALREIGRWLVQNKGSGHVFYFGDGRFVVAGRNERQTDEFCERITARFREPWSAEGVPVHLSVRTSRITASMKKQTSAWLLDLIHFFFSEDMREKGSHAVIDDLYVERMVRARNVERAIRRTIHKDSVEVWYQPIYSYRTGRFDTAEALVRIEDEELGRIMPDEFIPRAERTGQIVPLGRQIFRKVCALIRDHGLEDMHIAYIHVNLSPVQCLDEGLAEQLREDMIAYGVNPSMIEFEITETLTVETDAFHASMRHLADLGKGLALDDYGSGATNLNRMLQWNVNMVKIDREIIAAFVDKREVTAIATLVKMFHGQQLIVVAEGIETREMSDLMQMAEVDYAQGFYYARPMNEAFFLEFLAQNTK